MLNPQQTNAPTGDCWRQLLQLHKSLAELERFNTQGWDFLGQAQRLPSTADTICSKSIDPESWLKRAEEARALADVTADAVARRSLLDIADAYDALANTPS